MTFSYNCRCPVWQSPSYTEGDGERREVGRQQAEYNPEVVDESIFHVTVWRVLHKVAAVCRRVVHHQIALQTHKYWFSRTYLYDFNKLIGTSSPIYLFIHMKTHIEMLFFKSMFKINEWVNISICLKIHILLGNQLKSSNRFMCQYITNYKMVINHIVLWQHIKRKICQTPNMIKAFISW